METIKTETVVFSLYPYEPIFFNTTYELYLIIKNFGEYYFLFSRFRSYLMKVNLQHDIWQVWCLEESDNYTFGTLSLYFDVG